MCGCAQEAAGKNDDLILETCAHFCDDRAKSFMPSARAGPITLLRNIVLLTDDRNLRVKAIVRHVPARDIRSFTRWSRLN